MIPQHNSLFVIQDANLQMRVLMFTLDVPEGMYEIHVKRLTPKFVSPAVGEVTWLQLLSANLNVCDKDALKNKKEISVIQHDHVTIQIALKIQANTELHQEIDAINVVVEHVLVDPQQEKNSITMRVDKVNSQRRTERNVHLALPQRDHVFSEYSNLAAQFV